MAVTYFCLLIVKKRSQIGVDCKSTVEMLIPSEVCLALSSVCYILKMEEFSILFSPGLKILRIISRMHGYH